MSLIKNFFYISITALIIFLSTVLNAEEEEIQLQAVTDQIQVLIKDIRDLKNFSLVKNGFLFKKIKYNLEEKDIQNNYTQYKRDLSKFIKELFPYKYIDN